MNVLNVTPVMPFVDGVPLNSESTEQVDAINPSNGRTVCSIHVGSERDVSRAVTSARCAFTNGSWSESPPSVRKGILRRFSELIEASASELDILDAEEMGKPISIKYASAKVGAGLVRFYAEAVDKVQGDVYTSDKHSFVTQRRVPRGVVAAIVPWNFPTFNALLKIAPALAAANTVVLKPSELSSRSAMALAQLALEAGLPPGVLNVVPGLGETVGRALGLSSGVDMLTFTGSTSVGKLMLHYASQSNMKTVVAECGGKSPQVVFEDADLDAASSAIAQLLLTNQGQICSVGSRVVVQRSIHDALVDKVKEKMGEVVMGDALHPRTTFGPLASAAQCSRVMGYIEGAGGDGARLVTGGRRAHMESGGYFVEPTIFVDVAPASRLAQEEIFGPVLAVTPFEDEADAVQIANGTAYGLAAYVWTRDLSLAMRMATALRSNVVVNAASPRGEGAGHAFSAEPFGQSGLGVEGGLAGLETYLHRQLVWFNHA